MYAVQWIWERNIQHCAERRKKNTKNCQIENLQLTSIKKERDRDTRIILIGVVNNEKK